MAKAKHWYMQWDVDAWENDKDLVKCSMATRGIWSLILCRMHRDDRSGMLTGSVEELATLCRCTPAEIQTAIDELATTKTADVIIRNATKKAPQTLRVTPRNSEVTQEVTPIVTLINRRMRSEFLARKNGAKRAARYRQKNKSNASSNAKNDTPVTTHNNNYSNNYNQKHNTKGECGEGEKIEYGGPVLPPRQHAPDTPTQTQEERDAIAHVQRAWFAANGSNPANARCPGSWYDKTRDNSIQRTLAERGMAYIEQVTDWVILTARKRCEAQGKVFGWGWICVYLDTPNFAREKAKREKPAYTPPAAQESPAQDKPDTTLEDFRALPEAERLKWLSAAKAKPLGHIGTERIAAGMWRQENQ